MLVEEVIFSVPSICRHADCSLSLARQVFFTEWCRLVSRWVPHDQGPICSGYSIIRYLLTCLSMVRLTINSIPYNIAFYIVSHNSSMHHQGDNHDSDPKKKVLFFRITKSLTPSLLWFTGLGVKPWTLHLFLWMGTFLLLFLLGNLHHYMYFTLVCA